jgi:hypothetical protein
MYYATIINRLAQPGITPDIPPSPNRKTRRSCDSALYFERNLVARRFNKLNHFRALATRYDKLAINFLAGVHLASAVILINRKQAVVEPPLAVSDSRWNGDHGASSWRAAPSSRPRHRHRGGSEPLRPDHNIDHR